ncbi:MAG: uroporphyrinogen decarboxylase family protein [Candidatus Omnitrophica bacterium]|nr:uroporphyrinogen decarboxylase family protein [Candidatus Omnitrophota bacterium]
MTERERVLAVLANNSPDKTPWFGDLSWWYAYRREKGNLPAEWREEVGYLQLYRDAGCGIYLYAPCLYRVIFEPTVKIGIEEKGSITITRITTPVGTISSVQKKLVESVTSAYQQYFIKGVDDLKVMRYIFTHRRIEPDYADFERIDKLWDGWGIPCATTPCCTSALQTLLTRWAGVLTTIELLSEAREEVEQTIEEIQRSDDDIFEILAKSPACLFCFPENLSGEITGRSLMERYEIPYWEKRIRQLHQAGKYVILHNDGTLKASLPLLMETSLDGIEAVTPQPAGDLTLEEIKQLVGGKKTVWGGLPGIFFSPEYPENFFINHVRETLEVFPRGSRFVLGVADQVPPDADWNRIRLVRELVEKYG